MRCVGHLNRFVLPEPPHGVLKEGDADHLHLVLEISTNTGGTSRNDQGVPILPTRSA